MAPLTATGDVSELEDVLHEHILRVQSTLVQSVDRQLAAVEARYKEKQQEHEISEANRKNLGVTLYKTQTELERQNQVTEKLLENIKEIQNESKLHKAQQEKAEKETIQVLEANKQLATELELTRKELEEANASIKQLEAVNIACTTNVKIHRTIESKLEKEVAFLNEKHKGVVLDLELARRKENKLLIQNKEMDDQVKQKDGDQVGAQIALEKMAKEIDRVTEINKKMHQQWEEAITAMSRRDLALQAVEERNSEARSKITDLELTIRSLRTLNEEYERRLTEKDHKIHQMEEGSKNLQGTITTLEHRNKELGDQLSELKFSDSQHRRDLEKLTKSLKILSDENEKKKVHVSNLKGSLQNLKEEFESYVKNNQPNTQPLEDMIVKSQEEAHRHENHAVTVHNEASKLRNELLSTSTALNEVQIEKDLLSKKMIQTEENYKIVHSEARNMMHELERKEHDINLLKLRINELGSYDPAQPVRVEVETLKQELQKQKTGYDKLQAMWVETQKEAIRFGKWCKKLQEENSYLKTKFAINETVKQRTLNEMEESKKEYGKKNDETIKLYMELKRLQPIVEDLRQQNVQLEAQLVDARLKLEEKDVENNTAVAMLKAEIRRQSTDQHELKKERAVDERISSTLERKLILSKEMQDKLRAENLELQKQNFALNVRLNTLNQQYHNLRIKFGKWAESTSKLVMHRKDLALEIMGADTEEMASKNDQSIETGDEHEVIDISSMKLRTNRLSLENAHLGNERDLLKIKVDELSSQVVSLEKQLATVTQRGKNFEREYKAYQHAMKALSTRCAKAEKIAAFIELQLKEVKPNIKVNYQCPPEVIPSAHLLAALTVPKQDQIASFLVHDRGGGYTGKTVKEEDDTRVMKSVE